MIKKNFLWLGFTPKRYVGLTLLGIKPNDRFSHIYVLGKTGVGKTTLLEQCIKQDLRAGRGLLYIDPHSDSAKKVYEAMPQYVHFP